MTIDELISKLAKPTMVYRYAKAQLDSYNKGLAKGASKRLVNAEDEIRDIIEEYFFDIHGASDVVERGGKLYVERRQRPTART